MVTCPQCGHSNDPTAAFCDQCGAPLAGALPPMAATPSAAPIMGGSTCPSCGAAIIPGEAFCDSCGAALGTAPPLAQPMISGGDYSVPPANPLVYPPPPPVVSAAPIRLVTAGGQSYQLSGKTVFAIGREDAVSGIYPDVDTTSSGGFEGGVGRKHAEIVQQGTQWLLKDSNSVNGTWVNNQKLAANATQPLRSGDQIRLGKWAATFQQ